MYVSIEHTLRGIYGYLQVQASRSFFCKMLYYLLDLEEDAYRILFGCFALFIVMSLYFSFRTGYAGHTEGEGNTQ